MDSYKILIVEDEGLIARDLAERLTALGHQVIGTAGSGEEAVAKAGGTEVVLMDIRLDGAMDGIEAAARIRDRYRIPVVFLTAHADWTMIERAKRAGPYGYLVKPMAPAALQSTIEIAIYRHRMERQLAVRAAWERAVLGAISDAVISTDAEGHIRGMNGAAEHLLGCTEADATGKPAAEVLLLRDGDSGEPVDDPLPLAMLGDASVPLRSNLLLAARDGRRTMVEGAASPVKESDEILGAVLTLRDVTARRWEEQQLRQAQRMESAGRLAVSVAEEFTSVLAIIGNQSEQLERQFSGYTGVRDALSQIQQAITAGEQITGRLAGFGGRDTGRREGFSLNGMVRRMSKLIETAAGGAVATAIRLHPAAGKIMADPAQIEQMLMNLVLHARAAMPEGGRLVIETTNTETAQREESVRLTVAHTGESPDLESLFEPSSPENLALSIAQEIATEHGGSLSARRMTEGGVRFDALLPRWNEPAALPVPDSAARPSVLLIEGNGLIRRHLHNFFEANGYNLLEAVDAAEAATLCELCAQPPELVIADASDADSLSERYSGLTVLRVTGGEPRGSGEIRRPFTQSVLLERVAALLENQGARAAEVAAL